MAELVNILGTYVNYDGSPSTYIARGGERITVNRLSSVVPVGATVPHKALRAMRVVEPVGLRWLIPLRTLTPSGGNVTYGTTYQTVFTTNGGSIVPEQGAQLGFNKTSYWPLYAGVEYGSGQIALPAISTPTGGLPTYSAYTGWTFCGIYPAIGYYGLSESYATAYNLALKGVGGRSWKIYPASTSLASAPLNVSLVNYDVVDSFACSVPDEGGLQNPLSSKGAYVPPGESLNYYIYSSVGGNGAVWFAFEVLLQAGDLIW